MYQIVDVGHGTAHRIIVLSTYTSVRVRGKEEQPPRQIMRVVFRSGDNVGSFHQTLAVRDGLRQHVRFARTNRVDIELVGMADKLLDCLPMRVSQ